MLSEGRAYFRQPVWMAIFPDLAIMLTVMGFNFLGTACATPWAPA